MVELRRHFCVGLYLLLTIWEICAQQNSSLESLTKFIFYGKKNNAPYVSTSRNDSLSERITGCSPEDRYAIIVHGFNESCNASWAQELRYNLQKYRGGCIICMDYGAYSGNYDFLLVNFKEIAEILTAKLFALKDYDFLSCTAYIFGFSIGSRIVAQAGNDFGPQQIERIDLCELAGPGFDNTTTADPKLAALEVQCIHTAAGGLGTLQRNCHQDWLMGNCGISQAAVRPYPNGNHGLCTQFFNFAFNYDFPAVEKNKTCNETRDARDAIYWPRDFHMGYFQRARAKYLDQKNFYAETTIDPPFTPYTYPID